jgi:hypothetical protein
LKIIHKSSVILRINKLFTNDYLVIQTNEVFFGEDEVWASNAAQGMVRGIGRSCAALMRAMRCEPEQISISVTGRRAGLTVWPINLQLPIRLQNAAWRPLRRDVRQGSASRRRHVAPALLLC